VKFMKRRSLLFLSILLLTPNLALASWWNPGTWKIFNKRTDTTTLENRIKELEQKLEAASTSTPVVPKPEKPIQTPAKKAEAKPVNKVVPTPIPSVVTQPPVTVDYEGIFKNLLTDYSAFRAQVVKDIDSVDKNSGLTADTGHLKYLRELRNNLAEDIDDLKNFIKQKNQSADTVESFTSRLKQAQAVYKTSTSNYLADRQEEGVWTTKRKAIDYIKDHKTTLHQPAVHIEAARLLYIFDKFAHTKYSPDFETKKTQQETIEFANRFLIDQD
jgi:hypothetical protein